MVRLGPSDKILVKCLAIAALPFRIPFYMLFRLWLWLYARKTDSVRFGNKDAYGPLMFLASFAAVQGAGFFAAVQQRGVEGISAPITLYVILSLLTIIGIFQFHLKKLSPADTENASRRRYEFDVGSVRFARWTLLVTMVFTAGLPLAAQFNLLPGQERRFELQGSTVATLPPRPATLTKLLDHRNKHVDEWVQVTASGHSLADDQRLVIVEQNGSFSENYHTFTSWLSFGGNAIATGGDAYLVRGVYDNASLPTFDKLALLPEPVTDLARHALEVTKPNAGEFLVLFLIIEPRFKDAPFISTDMKYSELSDLRFSINLR